MDLNAIVKYFDLGSAQRGRFAAVPMRILLGCLMLVLAVALSAVAQAATSLSIPESDPNDSVATATALQGGMPGHGSLATPGDVDFWSFSATAGQVYRLEIFGNRFDHAAWNGSSNIPRASVIGPDGTTFMVGHDFFSGGTTGWQWGVHDMDTPLFRAATSGTHYVRVEQRNPGAAGGAYVLKVTAVSLGTLQFESESNNSPLTANPVTPGWILGTRLDEDDDYFSFTVNAGTTVYFEIVAYRNGVFGIGGSPDDDYFNPALELFSSDGSTVLAGNDDVFFFDPALSFRITASGTYFLRVKESPSGSDGDSAYFLRFMADTTPTTAESEPNNTPGTAPAISFGSVVSGTTSTGDADYYSFTAAAGDMVSVFFHDFGTHQSAVDFIGIELLGADGSMPVNYALTLHGTSFMNHLRAILPAAGTYHIRVSPGAGGEASGTDYSFQLVRTKDAGYESEDNDAIATADLIPSTGRIAGAIDQGGDVDTFSFSASGPGEVITISIYAGVNGGPSSNGFRSHVISSSTLSPTLTVVDGTGSVLASSPYGGTFTTAEGISNGLATLEVTFVAPSSGTFYVRVADAFGTGAASHLYMIETVGASFGPVLMAEVKQPINADGTSKFKAERGVIPVKFGLMADATPTCSLPAASLALIRIGGASAGEIDAAVYTGPADEGSQFRISDCQYIYNLRPSMVGPGQYRVEIIIGDVVVGSATFELR